MSLPVRMSPVLRLASRRAFTTGRPSFIKPAQVVKATATKYVDGTVNEPVILPTPHKAEGSYHWSFERVLSAALVPLVGATAVTSVNPVLDGVLSVAIVVHSHIGFDSVLVDYLHPRKFPTLGPVMTWLLRATTAGVLVGVYQFNTNDIGLTELIKKTWKA